jgi:hypothetical protein
MPQTIAAIKKYLPEVLANIVLAYFYPRELSDQFIAAAGCFEMCYYTHNINHTLAGACQGGHIEIAKLMISKGATTFGWGLNEACIYGHFDIVKLMRKHGANNICLGLHFACVNNHREIAELLVAYDGSYENECNYKLNQSKEWQT